jgi:hypothetical protein
MWRVTGQFARHDDVAGHQAAIDRKHDAGDRGRGVGAEKRDGANHLERLDDSAERNQRASWVRISGLRDGRSLQSGVRTVPGQTIFARML